VNSLPCKGALGLFDLPEAMRENVLEIVRRIARRRMSTGGS
jgi:hypothetical protein